MPKSASSFESASHDVSQRKRTRKARGPAAGALVAPTPSGIQSLPSQTKPLLIGIAIGAALTATVVTLGSRPAKTRDSTRPPPIASALARTAFVLLARVVIRRALAAAARQGVRKLANAWSS